MARSPAAPKPVSIEIEPIATERRQYWLLGTSPAVLNRVAEKAKRELLFPSGRKRTDASRIANLKHDPMVEYRASVYRMPKPLADLKTGIITPHATRLGFPANAFKAAMATAALDLPGTKKAEIGRLVWVHGYTLSLFGVPEFYMAVVRNSDVNHTPDIRTRAILPRWAVRIDVEFVTPKLNAQTMINLIAASGLTCGIGDGRQEKGKLSFGQFRLANAEDPEILYLLQHGGLQQQDAALESPEFFDDDSRDLLYWFEEEFKRRGRAPEIDPDVDPDNDDEPPLEDAA